MLRILSALSLALMATPVWADNSLSGVFTASAACPAYQSISRETNPGNVTTKAGERYELLQGNRAEPTHVRVVVPGASPKERWVSVDCGTSPALGTGGRGERQASTPEFVRDDAQDLVLAVNWQPAFCELNARYRECQNQRPNDFEASNFTLHGLWPQPRSNQYCNVSSRDRYASENGRWRDIAPLDLTIAQRRELEEVMPGSEAGLDRHQWIKHGSCSGLDQREYISDSLDLLAALNGSGVAALFAQNIGRTLSITEVRAAFDASFGAGAGQRVGMECERDGNRTLIVELRINLYGAVDGPEDFVPMIQAGEKVRNSCRSGEVDAVGFR